MPVRHVDPENRGERKRFVSLEQQLVGAEPLFLAEVASEVHKRVRGRSPFYEEMEHALFVASNGRDVARCAAFVNRRWQREKGDTAGPIQILRLLLRAKRYTRAGLIAIGVRDSQRGKHIGGTLASTLYRRYEELGLSGALYYPVNDHNLASRGLAESFGGRGRILYHA